MAELKDPFFFTGSFGFIRAYYNKTLKRYILSVKGGSRKDLIENNPAFARTRANICEFSACGMWASQLRRSLISINLLHQGYYFSEMVTMGKSILKHDEDYAVFCVNGRRKIV